MVMRMVSKTVNPGSNPGSPARRDLGTLQRNGLALEAAKRCGGGAVAADPRQASRPSP